MAINKNRTEIIQKFEKTDQDVDEYIQIIEEWFSKQPHLPRFSDIKRKKIELILFNSKFSVEKTKRVIEMHYTLRSLVPEFYGNWDPLSPEIQLSFISVSYVVLPKLQSDLSRVFVFQVINENVDMFDAWECFKQAILICEMHIERDYYHFGNHFIVDLKGAHLGFMKKLTPTVFKRFFDTLLLGYGMKLSGIHYINAHSILPLLMPILKVIFKPKLYERIKVHQNLESLHQCISKEILPEDYGGPEPPFAEQNKIQVKELEDSRSLLLNEIKLKSDETKRISELNVDGFGSVAGSFKKLAVD